MLDIAYKAQGCRR